MAASWHYDAEREVLAIEQDEEGYRVHVELTRREAALLDRYLHAQSLHGLSGDGDEGGA